MKPFISAPRCAEFGLLTRRNFPSIELKPGERYEQHTVYKLGLQ